MLDALQTYLVRERLRGLSEEYVRRSRALEREYKSERDRLDDMLRTGVVPQHLPK